MINVKYWRLFIIVSVLILFGAISCKPSVEVTAPETTPEHPAPAQERYPDIQGATARIITSDGKLTDDVNFSVNPPGVFVYQAWVGDIIQYLDVEPPDTPGQKATTAEGTYQTTYNNSVDWKNLSLEMHTFSAQLVTPSLTPLDPHMHVSVTLEVPAQGSNTPTIDLMSVQILCRVGYTPPGMPERPQTEGDACADVTVTTDVSNFKIIANKTGMDAEPGEGHFIYYFNVDPPTKAGEPALSEKGTYAITADSVASWLSVLPGEYKVWVQLVNNDNTPLEPPVTAEATIIVPIDAGRYIGY